MSRQIEHITQHAELLDNFCENMPDEAVSSTYLYDNYVCFYVKGAGDVLAAAIRYCRTRGYVTDAEAPPEKASSWEGLFTHGTELNHPRIRIHWSSTVCKMVQVGTKMVEQPIYELQCDEPAQEAYDGPMEPAREEIQTFDPPEGMPMPDDPDPDPENVGHGEAEADQEA